VAMLLRAVSSGKRWLGRQRRRPRTPHLTRRFAWPGDATDTAESGKRRRWGGRGLHDRWIPAVRRLRGRRAWRRWECVVDHQVRWLRGRKPLRPSPTAARTPCMPWRRPAPDTATSPKRRRSPQRTFGEGLFLRLQAPSGGHQVFIGGRHQHQRSGGRPSAFPQQPGVAARLPRTDVSADMSKQSGHRDSDGHVVFVTNGTRRRRRCTFSSTARS